MEIRIQKWGNSLAMRLPKAVVEDAELEEGSVVNVRVEEGSLVATPVAPRYHLDDLLKKVSKKNLHEEIEADSAVGRETW